MGLLTMTVVPNQLIDRVNEGIKLVFRGRLDFTKFFKARPCFLCCEYLGLGHTTNQIGDGCNGRLELGDLLAMELAQSLELGQILSVGGRRGLEPRLSGEDKLHGLFDIHLQKYITIKEPI